MKPYERMHNSKLQKLYGASQRQRTYRSILNWMKELRNERSKNINRKKKFR